MSTVGDASDSQVRPGVLRAMHTRQFVLYIDAERDRVWQALVDPALTVRYFVGLRVHSDWRAGAPISYRPPAGPPGAGLTGEIVHVEPGRVLVHSLFDAGDRDLGVAYWLGWELDAPEPGLCRVQLTCDDLEPQDDPDRDDAWCRLLSRLKTVLEVANRVASAPQVGCSNVPTEPGHRPGTEQRSTT
jgi:uncharacterized protein YndB with AHSA1/START domain